MKRISILNGIVGYKKKVGLAPGTLVHVGEEEARTCELSLIQYDADDVHESSIEADTDFGALRKEDKVCWLNVDGLDDVDVIDRIGEAFGVHDLILEDVLNTGQRPKLEEAEEGLFITVKMLQANEGQISSEQVSMIVGDGYVISFQERAGDVFESVRERLRSGRGRVRKAGADYLAYCLLDAIVDNYFAVLEQLGERIEADQVQLMEEPDEEVLAEVHGLKREMIFLRRAVWPLREAINALSKSDSPVIRKETRIYVNDVYDHTMQIIETLETFRDVVAGMFDMYLSSVSNRMNSVMKVLTIIATIFIPLSFIAGVYGMNFNNMPELTTGWMYPLGFWLMVFAVAVGMLGFFKYKKWL
ncbi:Magnesium transport protein CorA [Anaerohalosphaera lusitana]|uniref:Magnesium transport protein CorA n=1 Tax=Anaerohalosphaera lusitana TaxID=1936003 RepID=A0A1U9NI18_9BACT|nr:magnesium/cobalt transporter CorA [Anaerohalosphaera lusitana]AQT67582.1 Magnesium transport protein CorA [Anaerohalosphaera lusitana]